MTSTASPQPATSAPATARLTLRPDANGSGFLDGAWWPRSADLNDELPGLYRELHDLHRGMTRLTYRLSSWQPAQRRMVVDGQVVHLGGFNHQSAATVNVIDAFTNRSLNLMVVPYDTAADDAASLLTRAGAADDSDRPEALLETVTS
jgi:hypothetical protein